MDKREEHLRKTAKKEEKVEQEQQSELTPAPSGKAFHKLFSKEFDIKGMPYMHSYSLDKDIILYRAMLIILAHRLGTMDERIEDDKHDDSLDDVSYKKLISSMKSERDNTARFMTNDAMIALRDNEYASNYHENEARQACYNFLAG